MIVRLIILIKFCVYVVADLSSNYSNESSMLINRIILAQDSLPQSNNKTQQLTDLKINQTIHNDFDQDNLIQNNNNYLLKNQRYDLKIKNEINYFKVFNIKIKNIASSDTWFYFFIFILILSSLLFIMTLVSNRSNESKAKDEKLRELKNYIRTYREKEFL